MATLKDLQRDIARQKENIKKVVRLLNSRQTMDELANLSIQLIRSRVKTGYGVNKTTGNIDKQKLPPLSSSYIKYRQGLVEFKTKDGKKVKFKVNKPTLGEFGLPARSNLTLTGQMLDSFGKVVNSGSFRIFISNTTRFDSKKTNKQIAEYMTKRQPFFALTDGEQRILKQHLTLMVEKILSPR